MAGSLVCALAPNMLVLIVGRVLHGLGGGGLSSMGMIVLGDLVSPKERGRYYTYFSIAYTTAGGCGPALGGFIAENLHWSVIFWINIPLGARRMAITVVAAAPTAAPRTAAPARYRRRGPDRARQRSFMLALNSAACAILGARRRSWRCWRCALLMGRFRGAPADRARAADPDLGPDRPDVRYAIARHAFGWGSIIGLNIFLPMYLQGVWAVGRPRRAEPGGLHGGAEHQRRARRPGARPRAPLQALPMSGSWLVGAIVDTRRWRADSMTPLSFEVLVILIGIGFGPTAPLTRWRCRTRCRATSSASRSAP